MTLIVLSLPSSQSCCFSLFHVITYKYLGVEVDQSLTWSAHVNKIAKKISGVIGVLRRVRHLVPNHTLITMYNSLVLPYFDYCSIEWGNCGEGMCNRLQTQKTELNRAARVVTSSSYDRRSVEILDELGWDTKEMAISHNNV